MRSRSSSFSQTGSSSTTTATGSPAEQTWGTFQPAGLTQDRIQQIALHVSATYRTPAGHQLVSVSASIPPVYQNDLKITQYILSYNDGGQTNYQAVPISSNNVLYEMCGLGPRCSIDSGKATSARLRLLRREALELALYTFHYTGRRVGRHVPAAEEGRAAAVGVPLPADAVRAAGDPREAADAILSEPTPPPAAAIPATEAATIDGITEPDLYRFHYTSDQQGGVLLVFDPIAQ